VNDVGIGSGYGHERRAGRDTHTHTQTQYPRRRLSRLPTARVDSSRQRRVSPLSSPPVPDRTPDRRFDEREVALILQETAELQERAERTSDARSGGALLPARGRGLTLAQLEQIEKEAGLEPALVRRAAASVDARHAGSSGGWFLGSATTIDVVRVVAGELSEDAHEAMLEAVRRASGELGQSTALGRQFGWQAKVGGAKTQGAVSSGGGQTTVRVRMSLDELALGSFMTLGTGLGAGGGMVATGLSVAFLGPAAFAVGAAVLGSGYFGARRWFGRLATRARTRAEEIADEVAAAIEGAGDRGTGDR
jgi:hypothetical protein